MKSLLSILMSLVFVQTSAAQQSIVSGHVRLSGGLPVAEVQVMLFDLTDLQRGPVAQTTTDENGQFALPLVASGGSGLPQRFALGQNYPNPFNPATIIPYQLPTTVPVRLEVFNLLGQRVATLVDEERPAGFHTAQWDATNAAGQAVAAGVYLYRLTAVGQHYTRRMVLVDGQAGVAAVAGPSAGRSPEATERAYGIAVVGVGLAAYVDADFRVEAGMAPVEVVVEPEAPPARGKVVPSGLVGDVNADGRIDPADALLVMLYSLDSSRAVAHSGPRFLDSSRAVAHSGPRFLGDVNSDGRITPVDARLIMTYVANPFDKTLPARLGQPMRSGKLVASTAKSVVFILDVSGSMEEEVEGGGETRLNAAKTALSQVLRQAPTDGSLEYALTTFGERSGCSVDVPIEFTNDPQRVVSYASGLSPNGGTPLAEALLRGERLALDTTSSDDILLVLLSDGEESCDGDPVSVARAIRERGQVRLISVNAIGFGVEPGSDADQQIQAIAQVGGGDYFRASDTEDLAGAIGGATDIIPTGSFLVGEISRLTNHSADDGNASWSPDGRRIAFMSSRDGNNEIYVMDSDGSNLRRLTNHSADDGYPSWSPDGRSIAFHSSRDGNAEIYSMGSDGSNPRRLTNQHSAIDAAPVWSPDGDRIAFMSSRDGNFEVYVMDSDGSNPRRLTSNSATDGIPSWSPDSRQIAFESSRDGNFEVYVMDSDGSNPRRLTNNPATDGFPEWSPDGRHIAFHSSRDDNFEIYVMSSDGSDPSRLTNDPGNDYAPVWAPDGRNITFESSRDGNFEVYVMELREVRTPPEPGLATTMYWTNSGGTIQRANLDGSNIQDLVTGLDNSHGIALYVDEGKMYWTDWGDKIQWANLDGSNVQDLLTGLDRPHSIALDVGGGKMYWTNWGTDTIQRANLDGSNIQDLVTGLNDPDDIALDVAGGKMYWTSFGTDTIQRANLDGSNVQDLLTGLDPHGIALDVAGGKMYWTNWGDTIQRANLDGSNIQDLLTGLNDPHGIALDVAGGKMYWTNRGTDTIQRANLDGSDVQDLVTGLNDPAFIALGIEPQGPIDPRDANALSRAVSIPNSRLIGGLPPAPSTSSAAPDISGNLDQLISSNGSTFLLPFQYSTNSDLSGFYIWIRGADAYFDVPYTGSSGDRGTLNIPIGLPTNVEEGSFSVSYCVYDDRGLISNILSTSINVEQLGTGSLQISLAWDSVTDLDLWVTDTSGTKIYYRNKSSSTGGELDRDDTDGFGPENIYWSQAPNGTYKVEVNHYSGRRGTVESNYTVTVSGLGTSRQFTGTLNQQGQTNFVVNISKQGNRLTFDTSE